MIRYTRLCGVAVLLAATAPAMGAGEDSIYGFWSRGDGVARVQIEPCGGAVCAINTWIKSGVTAEKVGDRLVMNIEPNGAGILSGTAFDPQRDLNYRLKINLSGKKMTIQGCVLGGLVCKNMAWMRLSSQ